jgi:hypothetical protein
VPPDSTLHDVRREGAEPRSVLARRVGTVLLALVVLAGLLGFLGDRNGTAEGNGAGYTLQLDYAVSSRPGLDVPWHLEISNPEGFSQELTIAVTADYFDLYETQGWHPEPTEQTRDGEWLYLTFAMPDVTTFELSYDAYIQPNRVLPGSGEVAVVVDGERTATVPFRTFLFP